MLLLPRLMERAVYRYEATTPDVQNEGMNGYVEVEVTFFIKDLKAFTELWEQAYVPPSKRPEWYRKLLAQEK